MADPVTKIISWNVNGIRAVSKKGFLDWFASISPDILALQETKAHPDQLDATLREVAGYHVYWVSAEKKGYSGLALYSKVEPLSVNYGLGISDYDIEGRVMTVEYPAFTFVNAYFPSGTTGPERVAFKLAFSEAFIAYCENCRTKGKPVIFCGDVNIAHKAIDLANAKQNEKNSGFLPEERAWLDKITSMGYVDTFRHLYPDVTERYSWWAVRSGARERNIGWRIDYIIMSSELAPYLKEATILSDVMGSDHCPVGIELAVDLNKPYSGNGS
jgi:exodeoxyribonuclease-3